MLKDLILKDPSTSFMLIAIYNMIHFNPFYNKNISQKRNQQYFNTILQQNFNYYFQFEPTLRISDLTIDDSSTIVNIVKNNKELDIFLTRQFQKFFTIIYDINDIIFRLMTNHIVYRYLSVFGDSDIDDIAVYYPYYNKNISSYKILAPLLLSDMDIYNPELYKSIMTWNDNMLKNPVFLKCYAQFVTLLINIKRIIDINKPMTFQNVYHLPQTAGRFIYADIDNNIRFITAKIDNNEKLFTLFNCNNCLKLKQFDNTKPFCALDSLVNTENCIKYIDTINENYLKSTLSNLINSIQNTMKIPFSLNINLNSDNYIAYGYNIVYNYILILLQWHIFQFNKEFHIEPLNQDDYKFVLFYIESLNLSKLVTSDILDKNRKPFIDSDGHFNMIGQFNIMYISKMKPQSILSGIDLSEHSQDIIFCRLTSNPNYNLDKSINIVDRNTKLLAHYNELHIKTIQECSIVPNIIEKILSVFKMLIPILNKVLSEEEEKIMNLCDDILAKYNEFNDRFAKVYYNGNVNDFMVELKYYYEFDTELLRVPLRKFEVKKRSAKKIAN